MKQKKLASAGPAIQIVAGIDDREAGIWLEFSDGKNRAWIARADFLGDGQAAFIGLERQGIAAITHAAKANIRAQVQGFANFAVDRCVAVRPGWYPFYVMPDGTVVGPRGCGLAKPIVTFAPNVKCRRSPGNLKSYSDAFGPVVARQSLLLTVIAYSLSGAMLSVMCRSPHAILNTGLDF